MFRADLHSHTFYSDGTLSPDDLLKKASSMGLSGLCITDHDTTEAYDHITSCHGVLLGIGAEFSCFHRKESVHILAYDFDLKSEGIAQLSSWHRARREKRNRLILEKLAIFGIPISMEELKEVAGGVIIGRPHIAQVLIKKGAIQSIQEGFTRYLSEGKCAYVEGEMMGVAETLDVIHQASGKAFLAHPHLIRSKKRARELLDLGFDGLEAYYARFPLGVQKEWLKLAKDRDLLFSGGSDYHGEMKVHNPLGASWVDNDVFNQIFQNPFSL